MTWEQMSRTDRLISDPARFRREAYAAAERLVHRELCMVCGHTAPCDCTGCPCAVADGREAS